MGIRVKVGVVGKAVGVSCGSMRIVGDDQVGGVGGNGEASVSDAKRPRSPGLSLHVKPS